MSTERKPSVNPNSLDLPTLLKLIPDFETSQPNQVYRFVRSCDSAFGLADHTQNQILLIYALNRITGPNSSDIHANQFHSWPTLKQFLIQKFSQTKTLAHLNLELQSMFQKPAETVVEYYHRVDLCRNKILEKLAAEIADDTLLGRIATTEETALNVFMNGLNSDIGNMLRTINFTNLSKAGHFAIQEEKIRQMNNARQSLYKNAAKIFPSAPPPRRNITQSSNISMPPQQALSKLCNYCKKPGHLISECRKRAYNNNLRNATNLAPTQEQRTLPAPPRSNIPTRISHLNSQAAESLGLDSDTATTSYMTAQTPTSTMIPERNDINNIQFQ